MAKTENEPALPDCLGADSLVFAPTTGMRLAPEVLVFELFRELGYGDARHDSDPRARDLAEAVEDPGLSPGERLLLATCRGRTRQGRKRGRAFYAPAYPGLARHAWLRKKTDRTMRDYFLGGPLAHSNASGMVDRQLVVNALLGHRSARTIDEGPGKEILSLLAIEEREDPPEGELARHLGKALEARSCPLRGHEDLLAELITEDFLELCRLEAAIPRREWLYFLIAFLRIATAMWLLAHLRITVLVRDWLLDACRKGHGQGGDAFVSALLSRHHGLLHPSSAPTCEVFEHVESYMRARVELRLLVREIVARNADRFTAAGGEKRRLSLDTEGASYLTLDQLLSLARQMDWENVAEGPLRQWLTRAAEKWPAWRSPRTRGQGKNIDEFIRVLYRADDDDSGSGLLIRCPSSTTKIVPGHRLLQLFAFLAEKRKARAKGKSERGKLVLRDLEEHFFDYGVDFRSSAFGRPLLIKRLMEGGILVGSPDAGESAAVLNTAGNRSTSS